MPTSITRHPARAPLLALLPAIALLGACAGYSSVSKPMALRASYVFQDTPEVTAACINDQFEQTYRLPTGQIIERLNGLDYIVRQDNRRAAILTLLKIDVASSKGELYLPEGDSARWQERTTQAALACKGRATRN